LIRVNFNKILRLSEMMRV